MTDRFAAFHSDTFHICFSCFNEFAKPFLLWEFFLLLSISRFLRGTESSNFWLFNIVRVWNNWLVAPLLGCISRPRCPPFRQSQSHHLNPRATTKKCCGMHTHTKSDRLCLLAGAETKERFRPYLKSMRKRLNLKFELDPPRSYCIATRLTLKFAHWILPVLYSCVATKIWMWQKCPGSIQ